MAVFCCSLPDIRIFSGRCFVAHIRKPGFFRIQNLKGSHRVGIIPVFFGKPYKVLRCAVREYQLSGLSFQAAAYKRCRKLRRAIGIL